MNNPLTEPLAEAVARFSLSDFDFDLPSELIAQTPSATRTASRLLHVEAASSKPTVRDPLSAGQARFTDLRFPDVRALLRPGDVLVLNDTRVMQARLFGRKASGGRVELLIERIIDTDTAMAQLRASHAPAIGARIDFAGPGDFRAGAKVIDRDGRFYLLSFSCPVARLLDQIGELPLPPYIKHAPDAADAQRYQTVYAARLGAVAAPTAGLHFDRALLDALRDDGIAIATLSLHVGAGTFLPVQSEDLSEHRMHKEWYQVPADVVDAVQRCKATGGRVVAVGTTSLRALEAASSSGRLVAGEAETDLFITPGYRFRCVDRLLTNFHLPKSTLLMLVSAFAGYDTVRAAYAHAIAARYRFFSYGDAMLLERAAAAHAATDA